MLPSSWSSSIATCSTSCSSDCPCPRAPTSSVVVGDAASVIETLDGPFDLVIVDLYARLQAPAFVETVDFMGGCLRLLEPGGVLAVNVADAAGLGRLGRQARAIARVDPTAALLVAGDPSVLSGAEEGNAVLVAAPGELPQGLRERLLAHGPHPAEVLDGDRLDFVLWGAC